MVQLTTLFGIPVHLHWSFLALLFGFAVWSGPSGALFTLVMAVGLFGSVLLHELGHALAARRFGIRTAHITLFPFGGVAAIQGMTRNPRQELVIAIAGPAVNGVLFFVSGVLWATTGWTWLAWLALMNLTMGLFNLLPAFPMDGGRVFRALLATRLGWVRASTVAIRVGRLFAWAFIGIGLVSWSWNLALIGGFLLVGLSAEERRLVGAALRPQPRAWA
jgi:Zn-dependent protease